MTEATEAEEKTERLKSVLYALSLMPTRIERVASLAYACIELGLIVPVQSWLHGTSMERELGLIPPENSRGLERVVDVAEVYELCETMEDEAYGKLEVDELEPEERGYWRGQKHAAKTIRRTVGSLA